MTHPSFLQAHEGWERAPPRALLDEQARGAAGGGVLVLGMRVTLSVLCGRQYSDISTLKFFYNYNFN